MLAESNDKLGIMKSIVGIDEVGRGALAGPVVVGAVLIQPDSESTIRVKLPSIIGREIADSKQLTRLQRERGSSIPACEHYLGHRSGDSLRSGFPWINSSFEKGSWYSN